MRIWSTVAVEIGKRLCFMCHMNLLVQQLPTCVTLSNSPSGLGKGVRSLRIAVKGAAHLSLSAPLLSRKLTRNITDNRHKTETIMRMLSDLLRRCLFYAISRMYSARGRGVG
jgi:hypothetical protein